MVSLIINGKPVCVPEGTSILEAARAANIDIPTLCYLKDLNEIGACRICMVEVEGQDTLVAACDNEVHEGMVVHTNSQKVRMTRRVNLQLLLSQHEVNCVKCTRSGNCKLQKLANDYNLLGAPYQKKLRPAPVDYSAPILRFENRCVKCMRCVQVCDKVQGVHIWDLVGTGSRTTVGTAKADSLSQSLCTYCGQCVTHCPVGALEERDDTDHVYRMLADPTLTTVVQVAPAVRAAWTEYFAPSSGQAAPGVLASALRELGFDYVFDTNFSADLTIMEEGSEFIERFTHKDAYSWPMFTSCCPGWVRFVKGQFPQFAKNLSTAKSPQQMFGAVAKSYFADRRRPQEPSRYLRHAVHVQKGGGGASHDERCLRRRGCRRGHHHARARADAPLLDDRPGGLGGGQLRFAARLRYGRGGDLRRDRRRHGRGASQRVLSCDR